MKRFASGPLAGGVSAACTEYDQAALLVLRTIGKGKRDRRETEAVIQAQSREAMVLADDLAARKAAHRAEIECHGTQWIFEQFHGLGLTTSAELRSQFETLKKKGIRLPWPAVNRYLTTLGQDPL